MREQGIGNREQSGKAGERPMGKEGRRKFEFRIPDLEKRALGSKKKGGRYSYFCETKPTRSLFSTKVFHRSQKKPKFEGQKAKNWKDLTGNRDYSGG